MVCFNGFVRAIVDQRRVVRIRENIHFHVKLGFFFDVVVIKYSGDVRNERSVHRLFHIVQTLDTRVEVKTVVFAEREHLIRSENLIGFKLCIGISVHCNGLVVHCSGLSVQAFFGTQGP